MWSSCSQGCDIVQTLPFGVLMLVELIAHNKGPRRRKQTVAITVAVWAFKKTCLATSLAACLRCWSWIEEVVLKQTTVNVSFVLHEHHLFQQADLSGLGMTQFLLGLRQYKCMTVSLLLNWQELCAYSWYCLAQFGGFSSISSTQAQMAICVR